MNTPKTEYESRAQDLLEKIRGSGLHSIIDGREIEGQGTSIPLVNPANGDFVIETSGAAAQQVAAAATAARAAFDTWSRTAPAHRGRLIWELADALEARTDEFAVLESIDTGKPIADVLAIDIPCAVSELRFMAGIADKIEGSETPLSAPGEWLAISRRVPVGVVGAILPWNYPLMMAARKMGPALAAGCTLVVKPSEETPLTALRLAQLALEIGFPEGVVNVVVGTGSEAGVSLVEHPDVVKITFTGSTSVGKHILSSSANDIKRVTLELGGKSPAFVLSDADPEAAGEALADAIFHHSGQMCTAASRIYVHESMYTDFAKAMAAAAARKKVGGGFEDDIEVGPIISERHQIRIGGIVNAAVETGANIVEGGSPIDRRGFYYAPTIIDCVRPEMPIFQEEVFGPVACLATFKDEEPDALAALANATPYGLAASIWTDKLSLAHRLADRIRSGVVWINAHNAVYPGLDFGGWGASGLGRELSVRAIDHVTERRAVCMRL